MKVSGEFTVEITLRDEKAQTEIVPIGAHEISGLIIALTGESLAIQPS